MTKKNKKPQCDYHIALNVDCERFDYLWYALENFKENCEQSEIDVIETIQEELWAGIVEK